MKKNYEKPMISCAAQYTCQIMAATGEGQGTSIDISDGKDGLYDNNQTGSPSSARTKENLNEYW